MLKYSLIITEAQSFPASLIFLAKAFHPGDMVYFLKLLNKV